MLSEPEVVDLTRDARSFARIGTYSYADGNVTVWPRSGARAHRARFGGLLSDALANPVPRKSVHD
jgi:hypothetical protein